MPLFSFLFVSLATVAEWSLKCRDNVLRDIVDYSDNLEEICMVKIIKKSWQIINNEPRLFIYSKS